MSLGFEGWGCWSIPINNGFAVRTGFMAMSLGAALGPVTSPKTPLPVLFPVEKWALDVKQRSLRRHVLGIKSAVSMSERSDST